MPEPALETPPEAPPEPTQHWLDAYPNVKGNVRNAHKKYDSVEAALQGSYDVQQEVGRRVRFPDENSSDDDRAEFETSVAKVRGVPKTPEEYQVVWPEFPEGMKADEEFEKEMRAACHKLNMPQKTFQTLVDALSQRDIKLFNAKAEADGKEHAALEKAAKEGHDALKEEWGTDYSKNIILSKRAAAIIGGEEFGEWLNKNQTFEEKIQSNVPLAKICHYLGKALLAEGRIVQPTPGGKFETAKSEREEEFPNSPQMDS